MIYSRFYYTSTHPTRVPGGPRNNFHWNGKISQLRQDQEYTVKRVPVILPDTHSLRIRAPRNEILRNIARICVSFNGYCPHGLWYVENNFFPSVPKSQTHPVRVATQGSVIIILEMIIKIIIYYISNNPIVFRGIYFKLLLY